MSLIFYSDFFFGFENWATSIITERLVWKSDVENFLNNTLFCGLIDLLGHPSHNHAEQHTL